MTPKGLVNALLQEAQLDDDSLDSFAYQNIANQLELNDDWDTVEKIATAICNAFQKALNVDDAAANKLFRSKHTRWFLDTFDTAIRDKPESIDAFVQKYVSNPKVMKLMRAELQRD